MLKALVPALLRVVLLTTLVITLLLALALTAGRIIAVGFDDQTVSAVLRRQAPTLPLRTEGATLSWHRLTPVLRARTLRLGDSRIDAPVIAFDWLESLWRRGWVFSYLGADGARIRIEERASGRWALAGLPSGRGGMDWRTTLEHSDQIRIDADFAFIANGARRTGPDAAPVAAATAITPSMATTAGAPAALRLELRARNGLDRRRWSIKLLESSCGEDCRLTIELDERFAIPGLRRTTIALQAATRGRGVRLPPALLGGNEMRVAHADVRWDASARLFQAGRLDLDIGLADVVLAGGRPFDLSVSASGASYPGYAVARSYDSALTLDGARTLLPEFWMRWEPNRLRLFATALTIEPLLEEVARSRLHGDRLAEWIEGLELSGKLSNFSAERALDASHWAWRADLDAISLTGYQGAPTAQAVSGRVVGYERGMRAQLEADRTIVGFPGVFSEVWPVRNFSAALTLRWQPGYLAFEGRDIRASLEQTGTEPSAIAARFRLAVPADRLEQMLTLKLEAGTVSTRTAKAFVPAQIPEQLQRWLQQAPRAGQMQDVRFAFMGHVRGDQGSASRRTALQARLDGCELRFDERWPGVSDLSGRLLLSGRRADVWVTRGQTLGIDVAGSQVTVLPNGGSVALDLMSRFDGAAGLAYVRNSPLEQTLAFIEDDWRATGAFEARGSIRVRLDDAAGADTRSAAEAASASAAEQSAAQSPAQALEQVEAQLRFDLKDAGLELPSLRLNFDALTGRLDFATPATLQSPSIRGTLHERPIELLVQGTEQRVRIGFNGRADPALAYRILELDDPHFATGATDYLGVLTVPLANPAAAAVDDSKAARGHPRLHLRTDLQGIGLELPAELGKLPAERRETTVDVEFLAGEQRIALRAAPLRGWLATGTDGVRRGELEVRPAEPVPLNSADDADSGIDRAALTGAAPELPHVRLHGGLRSLSVAAGTGDGLFGNTLVYLDDFVVGSLQADPVDLGTTIVRGQMQGPNMSLSLAGTSVVGQVQQVAEQPLDLNLSVLRLPAVLNPIEAGPPTDAQSTTRSTLVNPALIDVLPAATVNIDALQVGDVDFGRWRFTITPQSGSLHISALEAHLRQVDIRASSIVWLAEPNQTQFDGSFAAGNLSEVLPDWGFAPTLETEQANVEAVLEWPGSPIDVDLLTVSGDLDFSAGEGRFLDVEGGSNALKVFSLLNFNTLAKRMNLDFSDVLGRGVSFETLDASVLMRQGVVTFRTPMEVDGTGSSFKLTGQVDLKSGELDNEMVVTLPLTKGLPWYAAYVALANPLAGLGVLVGERVLRKPLEQFSSARYQISGTLDAPQAKLVSIFDNEMRTEVPADQLPPEDPTPAAVDSQPPAPAPSPEVDP